MKTSSTNKSSFVRNSKNKISSSLMMTSALVAVGTLAFMAPSLAADYTLPTGGTIQAGNGNATISTSGIDKLNINQETDRVIINWNTFNIGADATVQFYQPNSGSLAVNKVTDSVTFTSINGRLLANGKIVILDPNGIVFGSNSITDVGSIVASTGYINDSAVMAGGQMELLNFGAGEIVNNGMVSAADTGLVALVARTVKNNGYITANLGRVSLAAGDMATVDLYGDGLIQLGVTNNKSSKFLSENTGTVKALGGKIQMSAASARDLVDSVVNMQGVLKATSAKVNSKGQIVLSADKVILGEAPKNDVLTKVAKKKISGDTTINAKSTDLGLTIDGEVTGASKEVNILSNQAKISQGLNIVRENGTVNVGNGKYNEHLVVSRKGVTLKSVNGASQTIVIPNSPGVTVTADNVTVDGFTFTGAAGLDGYGIFVDGGDNAILKNNIIDNVSQYGIYILGSIGTVISGNSINNTGNHGIFANLSNGTQILNNVIGTLGGNNNVKGDGIHIKSSHDSAVKGNTITETTSTSSEIGSGVHLVDSNNVTVGGSLVGDKNTISNAEWDAVKVTNGSNIVVEGNDFDNLDRVGVFAKNTNGIKVVNNDIDNAKMYGVQYTDAKGASEVTGNTIDTVGIDAVYMYFSNNVKVSGNTIGYGLDNMLGTADDTQIGRDGVSVVFSGNSNIINNKIANTKRNGIYVQARSGVNLEKNSIDLTGKSGLHLLDTSNAQVLANLIGTNAGNNNINGDGILVQNSHGTAIKGNTITETTSTASEIGSGVHVLNSDNVIIGGTLLTDRNSISNAEWDAVKVTNGNNILVQGNDFDNLKRVGVYALNTKGIDILDNDIDVAGMYGVQVDGVTGTTNILRNTIDRVGFDGVSVRYNARNVNISGNIIGYGADGILGTPDDRNTGRDGISVVYSTGTNITNNLITNSARNGVYTLSAANTYVSGNTIDKSGMDGVNLNASSNSSILGNKIAYGADGVANTADDTSSGRNGIFVGNSSNISINENLVNNSASNGIHSVNGLDFLSVTGNIIDDSGANGILVENFSSSMPILFKPAFTKAYPSNGLFINFNKVDDSTLNGISVQGSSGYAEIDDNQISLSGQDGINVSNFYSSLIQYAPMIEFADDDGDYSIVDIYSTGLFIRDNTISNSGQDGIDVVNSYGSIVISGNQINNSENNGIYVHNFMRRVPKLSVFGGSSLNLNIADNTIVDSYTGINLASINGMIDVNNNSISDSGYDGIYANNVNQNFYYPIFSVFEEGEDFRPIYSMQELNIANNTIDNSIYNGIELNQVGGNVTIDSNTITDSGYNGILAYNYSSPVLSDDFGLNSFAMYDRVIIDEGDYFYSNPINLTIINNTIENSLPSDEEFFSTDRVSLFESENPISNYTPFGYAGINLDISGEGKASISGNTIGNNFDYGIVVYSGLIDLTGKTNTIKNTNIGIGFYPTEGAPEVDSQEYFDFLASKLSLVDNTIGTTAFIDQSELFVDLGYGAMFAPGLPTILDGNQATYTLGSTTISPSLNGGFVSSSEYNTLESYFNHFNDFQNRGLFFFNILPDALTIDQKDVFRLFSLGTPEQSSGSLVISGFPLIGGVGAPVFDPNALEPAAGEDGETNSSNVAAIEPAAGGDEVGCWSDAVNALSQGTPVSFNYGTDSASLLNGAANCGSGQGQSL
jgi:filamentous hemagglutinin family protein